MVDTSQSASTIARVADNQIMPARPSLIERPPDADDLDRLAALKAATTGNAPVYLAVLTALAEAKQAYRLQLRTDEIRTRLAESSIATTATDKRSGADSIRAALDQLLEWKCVGRLQDPAVRATSIDDYLRRHDLWELTNVGRVTLDAVATMLRVGEESGALQRTMFRQIRNSLDRLVTALGASDAAEVYLQLQALDAAISGLAGNAREFYATINRIAREDRLDDHVFLVYKDQLVGYLQSFHDDLVRHRVIIADALRDLDATHRGTLLELATSGDDSVGVFGATADWTARWDAMVDWFVDGRVDRTEVEQLGAATTIAIRELLTLLRRLTEQSTRPVNRASELRETAAWFARCETEADAHTLFDAAFGLSPTLHVGYEVDDVDADGSFASWWDVDPVHVPITLRRYGRRPARGGTPKRRDYADTKRQLALMRERDDELRQRAARRLITIDLTDSPIEPAEWPVLLSWIDQALAARPAAKAFTAEVRMPGATVELASADTDTRLRAPAGVMTLRGCSLRICAA